jgi:omega-amidase
MKITIVQPDIAWEDKQANLDDLEKMLDFPAGATDLVILPEMFTTGFTMNARELAEDAGSLTSRWLAKMTEMKSAAFCGSYIVREGELFYNRFVMNIPSGEQFSYNKRHLFSISGEDKHYAPGRQRSLMSYGGFRINPIICYDLRFPVWIRNRNDCDLLICVANWPESRREVWNTLLKARAIENQCYVAGVNRIGMDNSGNRYSGESVILDAEGKVIAEMGRSREGYVTAEISFSDLEKFRKAFPVHSDADDFNLIL